LKSKEETFNKDSKPARKVDGKLQRLIQEARKAGGHKTREETLTAALEAYIRQRSQLRIIDLFGTIDYDPAYDYKAERRRR
jgi:hypothetical protein